MTAAFIFHQGKSKGLIALISVALVWRRLQGLGRALSLLAGGEARREQGEADAQQAGCEMGSPALPVVPPGLARVLGAATGTRPPQRRQQKPRVRGRASSIPAAAAGGSAGGTPPATVAHPPSALGERREQRRGELKKKNNNPNELPVPRIPLCAACPPPPGSLSPPAVMSPL